MFDVERFYHQACYGEQIDRDEVFQYISSFENVILWGAGNLGTAVGEIFLKNGIQITEYWDLKAEAMRTCIGIPVKAPFSKRFDADKTLIVSCIVNGSLGDQWTINVIEKNGYPHHFYGMILFEGLGCPLDQEHFDIRVCTHTKACSLCNCARYTNLLKKRIELERGELTFQLLTFIISMRCTLKCRYCGQRLTEYPKDRRKDFTTEAIFRDIDHVMGAVDFIGMVSVIGGEPFLHPDLNAIIEHLLGWENFGVINITTNGIFSVPEEKIMCLKHDRVKISFSVYDQFLTQAQKRTLENNIRLVERCGISYSISHPLWVKPNELKSTEYGVERMTAKKLGCSCKKMGASVRNGKFIACSTIEVLDGLGPYDVSGDIVDITEAENLRERLIENRRRPYYSACQYCMDGEAEEIPAGEQVEEDE